MKALLRRILHICNHIEEYIVIVCMFGITILTFVAVLSRYVFGFSISGADELASYMFLWAALFGASAGFRYDKHGGVPIIANLLPKVGRRMADLGVLLVMTGFFLFLSWYSWLFVKQSYSIGQISPATGIPVWMVNIGIFLALLLCAIRCLNAVIRDLTGRSRYPDSTGLPE